MPNTFERIGYQKGDQARGIQSSKDLSWWPHEPADSACGDPALKPHKSDSCPQLYKKTTFGTKKRLLAPSKTTMVGKAVPHRAL